MEEIIDLDAEQPVDPVVVAAIEVNFQEIWKEIIMNQDGTVNLDAVKRELYDFSHLIVRASEVFCHVTGGRISKPNTVAAAVIEEADNHYQSIYEEEALYVQVLDCWPASRGTWYGSREGGVYKVTAERDDEYVVEAGEHGRGHFDLISKSHCKPV